jgi:hypothetical protein
MTITSCRQAFALEQLACAAAAATQDLVRSLYGLSRVGFAGSSMGHRTGVGAAQQPQG